MKSVYQGYTISDIRFTVVSSVNTGDRPCFSWQSSRVRNEGHLVLEVTGVGLGAQQKCLF